MEKEVEEMFNRVLEKKKLSYKIKMFFQRLFRGYSDDEVVDLDRSIAKFVIPRLRKLREITTSYPKDVKSLEEWNYMLAKFLFYFECIQDGKELVNLVGINKEVYQWAEENLGKYLPHFWV